MSGYGTPVSITTLQLQLGNSGRAVKVCQQLLSLWGPGGAIPVTGTYDLVTVEACQAYQQAHGLVTDGICGPRTWESILGTLH